MKVPFSEVVTRTFFVGPLVFNLDTRARNHGSGSIANSAGDSTYICLTPQGRCQQWTKGVELRLLFV